MNSITARLRLFTSHQSLFTPFSRATLPDDPAYASLHRDERPLRCFHHSAAARRAACLLGFGGDEGGAPPAIEEGGRRSVWVEGEVSNFRRQASGHQYFTLKDATSQLACVLFARGGSWRKPGVALADGMQVQVRGAMTVYEARGQYQLNVQMVQAAGAGLLQAKFEALKRKLEAEGLFAPERKRALPVFPATVALVTSPTGAALRDMLNILTRRAPWLRVIVSPVRVQGDGAAEEMVAALGELNAWATNGLPRADVIVIGRGGGSAEDLWEFNPRRRRWRGLVTRPRRSRWSRRWGARSISRSAKTLRGGPARADAERGGGIDRAGCSRPRPPTGAVDEARMQREISGDCSRAALQARPRLPSPPARPVRELRARLDAAAQEIDLATEALQRMIRGQIACRRAAPRGGLRDAAPAYGPTSAWPSAAPGRAALHARFGEIFQRQFEACRRQAARAGHGIAATPFPRGHTPARLQHHAPRGRHGAEICPRHRARHAPAHPFAPMGKSDSVVAALSLTWSDWALGVGRWVLARAAASSSRSTLRSD